MARASEIAGSNRIGYLGAALGWERGPFSLQLMATDMSMSDYTRASKVGVGATAAYRVGRWKPYLTGSRSIIILSIRALDDAAGVGPPQASCAVSGRPSLATPRHDQTTIGVGVRYDFADNMALKLQFDRIDAKPIPPALLDDRGFVTGPRSPTVFSNAGFRLLSVRPCEFIRSSLRSSCCCSRRTTWRLRNSSSSSITTAASPP